MKVKMGLDFVMDANWKPKDFLSLKSIINYGNRVMPDYLKAQKFQVALCVCDEYIRLNYGRKV